MKKLQSKPNQLKINLKRENNNGSKNAPTSSNSQPRRGGCNTTVDELSETQAADSSNTQLNNYSTLDSKVVNEEEDEANPVDTSLQLNFHSELDEDNEIDKLKTELSDKDHCI